MSSIANILPSVSIRSPIVLIPFFAIPQLFLQSHVAIPTILTIKKWRAYDVLVYLLAVGRHIDMMYMYRKHLKLIKGIG